MAPDQSNVFNCSAGWGGSGDSSHLYTQSACQVEFKSYAEVVCLLGLLLKTTYQQILWTNSNNSDFSCMLRQLYSPAFYFPGFTHSWYSSQLVSFLYYSSHSHPTCLIGLYNVSLFWNSTPSLLECSNNSKIKGIMGRRKIFSLWPTLCQPFMLGVVWFCTATLPLSKSGIFL